MPFSATCDKCKKTETQDSRTSLPKGWHEASVRLDNFTGSNTNVGVFCGECLAATGLRPTDYRPHISETTAEKLYDLIVEIIDENAE